MRRGIIVLLIVVFSQFLVMAVSPSVDIQVSPYSYQRIMMKSSVNYDSVYGFGGKVGINLKSASEWGFGFELAYINFRYREFSEPYHVLSLLAKYGFSRKCSESFSVIGNLNLGADLRSINSVFRIYPSFGLYAGLGFKVSEGIKLTAGVDVHAVLQVSERSVNNALDVGLLGMSGVQMDL